MAERDPDTRGQVFIRRSRHLNLSFVFALTAVFLASLFMHESFSMPVSPKLVSYVYLLEVLSGAASYTTAFLLRRRFPVSTSDDLWTYKAVRIYFWSYILLSIPFDIAFLFYLFAGNLSTLVLGYLISVCGLMLFRPRRGDVR